MALNALDRHLALVGFMGAGKTTMAASLAEVLVWPVVEVDRLIEERYRDPIPQIFEERGEKGFRQIEAYVVGEAVERRHRSIIDLGGGAVTFDASRDALDSNAFTVFVDVDADTAWRRCEGTNRPLAQDEATFRRLFDERQPLYREAADVSVVSGDVDGAILGAAGIHHEFGGLDRLGELVPGDGAVALVADATVMGIYGPRAQEALGDRLVSTHELPPGEPAKQAHVLERLWSELSLDRAGTVVALGGGALTDVAGYAAATYLRGVPWVAVPTTLVGQVDAGIGGKTAIDLAKGKNLVGAFHWPAKVVIDETLLATLPERERRQGLAELVKTQLLAGHGLDVRSAAAYKAAICLRDPHDRTVRRHLNLGHTFAHALEAAADFDLPHGDAVALGLLAALELSGRDPAPVVEALDPQRVGVDPDRAWEALLRDKKREHGEIMLVLLGDDGAVVEPRDADVVRAALERLIV